MNYRFDLGNINLKRRTASPGNPICCLNAAPGNLKAGPMGSRPEDTTPSNFLWRMPSRLQAGFHAQ